MGVVELVLYKSSEGGHPPEVLSRLLLNRKAECGKASGREILSGFKLSNGKMGLLCWHERTAWDTGEHAHSEVMHADSSEKAGT